MKPEQLVQITSAYFCAGIVAREGRVIVAAPILHYMKGWEGQRVKSYCQQKGWAWTRVNLGDLRMQPALLTH